MSKTGRGRPTMWVKSKEGSLFGGHDRSQRLPMVNTRIAFRIAIFKFRGYIAAEKTTSFRGISHHKRTICTPWKKLNW